MPVESHRRDARPDAPLDELAAGKLTADLFRFRVLPEDDAGMDAASDVKQLRVRLGRIDVCGGAKDPVVSRF
jgi:hypothetical protein